MHRLRKQVQVAEFVSPAPGLEGRLGNCQSVKEQPKSEANRVSSLLEQGLLKFEFLISCALGLVKDTTEFGLATVTNVATSVYARLSAPTAIIHRNVKVNTPLIPPLPVSQQPEKNLPEFDPDNLLATYEIIPSSCSHPSVDFWTQNQHDPLGRGWARVMKLFAYFAGGPKILVKQQTDD